MKLGGIYISVGAKTKKLKRDLAKAEGLTKKTAVLMRQEIGRITFAKVGIAATAFAAAYVYSMKKAIDAASDLQEVQGKFDVVFARHGKQAESMAKILVKSYAMSEREAKQYMSSIQDLLVPMGMAADKALLMSNEVVKLSADLASFNNLPTAQVMLDIQSALVGNFETMKKYGVILNEHVVKEKAFEMGLYSGKGMVDANTKALIAYTLMVEDSSAAIGDQERTMGSYANQMKQLKAHVENIAAAVGNKLLPEVTAWVNQLNTMIETNPQVIEQIGDFAKNMLDLATAMGKVVGLGAKFINIWVKSAQAMGLASAGVITWSTALTDGANAIKIFNEELGIEKLRLLGLERIMARTKDWPGVYTQEAYQKAKQEAEILREIIESRKTLAAFKAPGRLEEALEDPSKYYGALPDITPAISTEIPITRTKEYYKQLEALAQEKMAFIMELEDEETRIFEENLNYRFELKQQYYKEIEAAAQEARDIEEEMENEKMRMATETAAYQKELNAQRFSDIQTSISMMTQGFQTISEMGGKHSKEAFAMYKGFKIIETTIATYSAATKAYESLVGIPLIGPFIAPAAAAAAVAFGMAQVAMIKSAQPPSYETGIDYVPRTGPAILHEGEQVIPKDKARKDRGKQTINVIMNNPTFQDLETQNQTMAQIASIVAAQVAPGAVVENYQNDGEIRQMVRGGM